MYGNLIITIGRECGSGGRTIGQLLAKKLGINCYDKELLAIAAKNSGLSEEILSRHDEKPTNSFLYSLVMETYAAGYDPRTGLNVPMDQKVFLAQFDAIKELAEKESCVIVGRCADYALENHPNTVSVFITASDPDQKAEYVQKLYGIDPKKTKDFITKTDKKRASYYNYYSNKKWGAASSYDLCINTTVTGLEGAVETIISFIENRKEK